MESGSQNNNDVRKGKLRMWTLIENKALVECLVTLRTEQKYMVQNGFKPGHVVALQEMMESKLPGTDIQGNPHIMSRLRAFKRMWQAAHDMVYGKNTSGFRWNPETKLVTAEESVWAKYIKAHPRAAQFRNKTFPYFEELCFVFRKDRAIGDECVTPHAVLIDIEDEEGQETPFPHVNLSDNHDVFNVSPDEASTSARRKRKRTHSDVVADALKDTVTTLVTTIKDVFEKFGQQQSGKDRQAEIDQQRGVLYEQLLALDGLTRKQRNAAHCMILQNDRLLNAFTTMPPDHKMGWVLDMLDL